MYIIINNNIVNFTGIRGLKTINNNIIHLTRENNERKSFKTRKKYTYHYIILFMYDCAREFSIKHFLFYRRSLTVDGRGFDACNT